MRNSQRFAKCSHLWPSSVFKRTPVAGFQIITVLSELPLAMLPSIDQATARTGPLPFLNMSVTALHLSIAERGRGRRQNRYFNYFAYATYDADVQISVDTLSTRCP
jgi:hypothetical protein